MYLLERQHSHSNVNQALRAIKYLLKEVCAQHDIIYNLPRPKKERILQEILHPEEVLQIINALTNLKHKFLLYLAYSSGLRLGEIVRLQVNDIDSKRMVIHVRQVKPEKWLFPSMNKGSHITEESPLERIIDTTHPTK